MYAFGLFATDIFVNAGQVVTGNLSPYFLTVCKPNYTALGCQQVVRFINQQEACTGNEDDILHARKSFPSKEAAISVYAALYVAVSKPYVHIQYTIERDGLVKLINWSVFVCVRMTNMYTVWFSTAKQVKILFGISYILFVEASCMLFHM